MRGRRSGGGGVYDNHSRFRSRLTPRCSSFSLSSMITTTTTTIIAAATTAFLLLGGVVVDAQDTQAETITVTSPVRSVDRCCCRSSQSHGLYGSALKTNMGVNPAASIDPPHLILCVCLVIDDSMVSGSSSRSGTKYYVHRGSMYRRGMYRDNQIWRFSGSSCFVVCLFRELLPSTSPGPSLLRDDTDVVYSCKLHNQR